MNIDKTTRREFLAITAGAATALTLGSYRRTVSAEEVSKSRLLHRIDCTKEFPPEMYFALGEVKVVNSPAGHYRESQGAPPAARFGYRFSIENVGRPHVAVMRYPDDKQRFMCIMDGTGYDLTTGVCTGWAQPVSGTMLELRQVFWPRWQDCSIVLMTFRHGEPAAAASIEIYELDDLPALTVPGDRGDGTRRELGIQYEDPCGTEISEGARNRDEWIDHLTQYARYSGQNLLVYPMAWYHGPQFPSQREPSDGLDWIAARDRKQYIRWTSTPDDWYATLLERFGKVGLQFQGSMTLLRLGSLMKKMNINVDAIRGGADTFNNMRSDGQVQSSTNDWTLIYNAINLRALTKENKDKKPLEAWSGAPAAWAYGERQCGSIGPMFNPLHPTVQEAILGFVNEIGERYAKYPAFKGISFNMFLSAMPWFGTIHFGYDDYSIALFEKETGINVPADPKAADRFAQRYKYLTETHRAAWIAWRCKGIRKLFGRIRQSLIASRADLRIAVTLWDETVVNALGLTMEGMQFGARKSMAELYREDGIDIDLYRDEPGLEIDRMMGNSRDRGGHWPTIESIYRDADFLEQDSIDAYSKLDRPGAFLFNCWVEEWGKTTWFRSEDGDPNIAALSVMDGHPAEGIFRQNSEYPKDGFWWDSQSRITPGFQGGVHFLEPYAAAVADLDACRITRGGLFLDKAHSEQLQQFAQAYRALPRHKFDTVGTTTDPVAVRTLVQDGRRYVYFVNRDYYPVRVDLQLANSSGKATDLATNQPVDAPAAWQLTLGPYELRSFAVSPETEITGVTVAPPDTIAQQLQDEANQALAAFSKVRAAGQSVAGMNEIEVRLRAALADGKLALLRRMLTSYIVRKCRAMSST